MSRQQLQSGLGIFPRKGIDTYSANRKPDSTSEGSIVFPSLYLVNPVSSDGLVLNADGVLHPGVLSVSRKSDMAQPCVKYNRSEQGRIEAVQLMLMETRPATTPSRPTIANYLGSRPHRDCPSWASPWSFRAHPTQ